jgi:hypothetical protein
MTTSGPPVAPAGRGAAAMRFPPNRNACGIGNPITLQNSCRLTFRLLSLDKKTDKFDTPVGIQSKSFRIRRATCSNFSSTLILMEKFGRSARSRFCDVTGTTSEVPPLQESEEVGLPNVSGFLPRFQRGLFQCRTFGCSEFLFVSINHPTFRSYLVHIRWGILMAGTYRTLIQVCSSE